MEYKMVVLDLDGTLLNDNKEISQKNIYILNELHNKNIEIVIATGRNYYMAKTLIAKILTLKPVVLANNGAITRCSHDDSVLDYSYLEPSVFEKIYKEGLRYNLNPVLYVDEYNNGYDLIYEKENYEEAYSGYIKKGSKRAINKKIEPLNINNILSVCYIDTADNLSKFVENIGKYKDNYNILFIKNVMEKTLLEFLHPNGCKWNAISKYAASKGILPEEIISIGDDNNDVELLKNSGLGIAMINGTEESKKAAKVITKYDNNNSGVYYSLSSIFNI